MVDARSATKLHVLEHVADYVEENVTMVDGRPHRLRWGRREPLVAGWKGMPLWVCPRSGLLRRPPAPRAAPARFGRTLRLSPHAELREIDGRWTFVELARIPADDAARAACVDVLVGPLASWLGPHDSRFEKTFGRSDAFAIATREPGRRELARVRAMT